VKILFCTVEAPLPPPDGFRLALGALLEQLDRRGNELRLVGLRTAEQRGEAKPWMRLLPAPEGGRLLRLVRATMLRRPVAADSLAGALRGALEQEVRSFRPDVVHVSSGRLAALAPTLEGKPSVLAALDAWHVNVEGDVQAASGLRRRVLEAEAGRVRRFEAAEYRRFGRVIVVTEEDADALRFVDPSLQVAVIPNGVDAEAFSPGRAEQRDERQILFTGVMDYAPNVAAAELLARGIFPRIRAARPDAQLAIVGRAPAPRVLALAELPGVTVTGEVPEVAEWLAGSRAYACPMVSGTGIKNKLLEAMACELPCVATPLALQGLHVEPGVQLLVGKSDAELAAHLLRVLSDDEEAKRLGRAARAYVLAQHDWGAVADDYERVYEDVLAPAPPAT
jgi:glycosyltransferase involved in cell wall biosynthesis